MARMMQVRNPSRNPYAQEPSVRIPRSQFDLSHTNTVSFDASYLYPVCLMDVIPGDTFQVSVQGFARIFSPLESPIMDNIRWDLDWFFVPDRLVWENNAYFHGEHDDAGAQDTDYTYPICSSGITVSHDDGSYAVSRLLAYLGLPEGLQTGQVEVKSMPLRGYNLIYNEFYRDQNLIDSLTVQKDNGPDTMANYAIRKSAKKHDYFTSALPYLQKGDPVTVPIGTTAPITGLGVLAQTDQTGPQTSYETSGSQSYSDYFKTSYVDLVAESDGDPSTPSPQIYADLSSATGVSINSLRESVAIQRWRERDARGGTRYTEMIYHQYGVTNPDFRLQRPEYLGGGSGWINITPVANTSDTASVEQGELRGIGTGQISGAGFSKSFTEFGYIFGIIRARGEVTYFQGVERHWTKSTRQEVYVPALAMLGEQSILNKELYVSNSAATDDAVFGYTERWNEYRYKPSRITGVLNPDVSGALSQWHLAEDFGSLPTLNQTFIEDQTPMSRVTTITTEPDFLADIAFRVKAARPIPLHSVPSLTSGRF